jgi:hypothetical protein
VSASFEPATFRIDMNTYTGLFISDDVSIQCVICRFDVVKRLIRASELLLIIIFYSKTRVEPDYVL